MAAEATLRTDTTSLPSTCTPGMPYELARSASRVMGVVEASGLYSPYRLFSITKRAGRRQTAARLRLSWKAPMFVAPSPKNATLTAPVRRYCADSAAPTVIGRFAPTIAFAPSAPRATSAKCIEPGAAAAQPA